MPENNKDKQTQDEFDNLVDNGSIEDIFSSYLMKIYGVDTSNEPYMPLIVALRDAFFAGMAVGKISDSREHGFQLLQYAMTVGRKPEEVRKVMDRKEGWIH